MRRSISIERLSTTKMKNINLKNVKPHWSLNLVIAMKDEQVKIEEDDHLVVIKDKYPKARFHYLILPKKEISKISAATKNDLEVLRHMELVAKKYANKHKQYEFKIGYHAVPSMEHLHLHVISTDFDSPSLKTKDHWNSFTTPFFLDSDDVCKEIEEHGQLNINVTEKNAYLKTPLKCHKCPCRPKNLPELKRHIVNHIVLN